MMRDLVLDGFVRNFASAWGFTDLPESNLFEAFVASALLRKFHQADLSDIEEHILVGGSGDGGIDAIAVLVNGRPVHTEEDVQFFTDNLRRLDVDFVFIQSKETPHFRAADIGTFTFGVEQFFVEIQGGASQVNFRTEITNLVPLIQYIYQHTIQMQKNPRCHLYFATTGTWSNHGDPLGRFSVGAKTLTDMGIFSHVSQLAVDATLLKSIYRELERGVIKEVELNRTAVFPKISGVDDAYIGLLSGSEFISLVSTPEGELNRELFYDNVRDFQGNNPVNNEINQTLVDADLKYTFPLLNNGITIVARELKRTGDRFTVSDFQIVNGCQTTHILFQNKDHIDAATFIPVKLVATRDRQVITDVIKATNRQTAVLPEALESLTPFHRELEDFYLIQEETVPHVDRIYYERRSKQYNMEKISQRNIVTLTGQIKSFIGMFLNEPHSHPRYYGELLRAYEGRIFAQDHDPAPYYASGVALLALESWLNGNPRGRSLKAYKHQLLMVLRSQIAGRQIPLLNSKDIVQYSLEIAETLRNPNQASDICEDAVATLETALNEFPRRQGERNPPHRLRVFTDKLLAIVEGGSSSSSERERGKERRSAPRGQIKWFDEWKNYGFIAGDDGEDYFVHGGEIEQVPWHRRMSGQMVEFSVGPNPRTRGQMMALKVRLGPDSQF